jgi:hypothetical protein
LKLIKGNPGKRPLPKDEPQPDPAIPEKPDYLDAEASKEWDRIVPELERLGLLTQLDRAMLVSYCQAWSAVVELPGRRNFVNRPETEVQNGPVRPPFRAGEF